MTTIHDHRRPSTFSLSLTLSSSSVQDSITRLKHVSKTSKGLKELKTKSTALYRDVIDSNEAKELKTTATTLFKHVETSTTGQALLNAFETLVEDKADDVIATTDKIVQDTLSKKTDVRNLLVSNTTQTLKDVDTAVIVKTGLEHTSKLTDSVSKLAAELDSSTSATRKQADKAAQVVASKLEWLQKHNVGQTAIKGVTQALRAIDKKGVDASLSDASALMADPVKRKAFFDEMKTKALHQLMAFLPNVKVKEVKGSRDGVDFCLRNLQLSRFRVPPKDVTLTIVDGAELHLVAKNITFDVRDVSWSFAQTYLPYLSGEGRLDCSSTSTTLVVVFKLDVIRDVVRAARASSTSTEDGHMDDDDVTAASTTTTTTTRQRSERAKSMIRALREQNAGETMLTMSSTFALSYSLSRSYEQQEQRQRTHATTTTNPLHDEQNPRYA